MKKMALIATLVELPDGSIRIKIDDAVAREPTLFEPVGLFAEFNCSNEDLRAFAFSDEQFADLGNAILARLAAFREQADKGDA